MIAIRIERKRRCETFIQLTNGRCYLGSPQVWFPCTSDGATTERKIEIQADGCRIDRVLVDEKSELKKLLDSIYADFVSTVGFFEFNSFLQEHAPPFFLKKLNCTGDELSLAGLIVGVHSNRKNLTIDLQLYWPDDFKDLVLHVFGDRIALQNFDSTSNKMLNGWGEVYKLKCDVARSQDFTDDLAQVKQTFLVKAQSLKEL